MRCLFEFRVHTWAVFGVIKTLIFFCLNLNQIILDRVRISLPLWYQGLRRTIFACTILGYSLDFDTNTYMDEAFRWSEIMQSVNLPKRSVQFYESQTWPCETLIIFGTLSSMRWTLFWISDNPWYIILHFVFHLMHLLFQMWSRPLRCPNCLYLDFSYNNPCVKKQNKTK